MGERMVVRSYRRVFRVDRRIYRVDRWALPVPGGIPLCGLGYFALALLGVLLCERLPLLGGVAGAVSAPLRYVVAPLAIAVLLAQAAPDGRPAYAFVCDWLWLRLRSRRRSAGRRVPGDREPVGWSGAVVTRWDEHAPRLREARVHGPASVTFGVPVELARDWRCRPVVRERRDGRVGVTVEVADGEWLGVRR